MHPTGSTVAALLLVLLQALAPAVAGAPSTPQDIAAEFAAVPCDDQDRLAAVRALLGRAGAPAAELRIEAFDDVENLVLVKPGRSPERIVVGAHYDKVAPGCGAVDNWSGQVALAHLYRSLRDVPLQKTLVFVAFGREEKGLVGSRAMTRAIDPSQAAGYCAMVNIDSLGLGPPRVADNMSSRKLARFAGALAREMDIPFGHGRIRRANSDSSPFVARGIPALTLHGLDRGWRTILHSDRDQPASVDPANVHLGYRLALGLLERLDQAACDAYR